MKKYIILLIFCLTTTKLFADSSLNQQVIGDIEKHLFFSDEASELDSINSSYKCKESLFNEDKEGYEPKFDIIIIDADFDKKSNEKKKLAYNANLIGHYEIAIKLYKEIISKNTDDDAKFGLAFAYQNLRQYPEAKELYHDLLKTGKKVDKDQIVNNLLAIIIEENPKEAVFFLTKLSAQHPDSSSLIAKSALTYEKINRPERAVDLMKKALFIEPDNFQYQYNLAIMLDKKGDYKDAKGLYDKILSKLSRSQSEKLGIPLDQIYKRAKYLERSL